jgi:hypothetical protein
MMDRHKWTPIESMVAPSEVGIKRLIRTTRACSGVAYACEAAGGMQTPGASFRAPRSLRHDPGKWGRVQTSTLGASGYNQTDGIVRAALSSRLSDYPGTGTA